MISLRKLLVIVALGGLGASLRAVTPAELVQIKELVNTYKYACARKGILPPFCQALELPGDSATRIVENMEAARILGRINAAYIEMCRARESIYRFMGEVTVWAEDAESFQFNCQLVNTYNPAEVAERISEEEFAALEASMDAAARRCCAIL